MATPRGALGMGDGGMNGMVVGTMALLDPIGLTQLAQAMALMRRMHTGRPTPEESQITQITGN